MSLVFYDTETTGTEVYFDQILQFAAVRTDQDLNEIDRFETRCRLLPHVVPAPRAMLVTGVKASHLADPALPSHYSMVRELFKKFDSWSPALFLGWNSIQFDEHLIRQALYKTLHNPYLTNRAGNSRSDVMRMAQACSLFAPNALRFSTDANGQKIFKLNQIAPANGFNHDQAHDAMGDVEAMIFLCRRLLKKAPKVWSSFMRFSTKAAVVDFITEELVYCVNDFFFGRPHSCIVTTIGQSKDNGAEWYVYNLDVDPQSLKTLSKAQLTARLDQSPKPLRRLKSNAAPMLFPAEDAPKICSGLNHGLKELERRAASLKADATLRDRLVSAFESNKEEYPPSIHFEKQIYNGFIEKPDEELMDVFHEAEWPKRLKIVEKFSDPRLRAIGMQLIYLERPDLLDKSVRLEHDLAAAKRLLGQGDEISWLTLPQAIQELQGMTADSSGAELKFLEEHEQYLCRTKKQAGMCVSRT